MFHELTMRNGYLTSGINKLIPIEDHPSADMSSLLDHSFQVCDNPSMTVHTLYNTIQAQYIAAFSNW